MIAVFDASVLIFLFEKEANAPLVPGTDAPLARCYDRVNFLISTLESDNSKIVIPAPALGEILVKANAAGPEWLRIINSNRNFRIAPFDERAAVEFAEMQRERKIANVKSLEPRAKAKFDDQIIAIARVERADMVYSADDGLKKAASAKINVIGLFELSLPPEDPQPSLFAP